MRQLFHTPVLHFDDANGRPLVGGRLYSYKAGTSTPVNLFRNETGSEVHTNPIVLNMRGECVAYGVDGMSYKLVLTDCMGVTIWEKDNIHPSMQFEVEGSEQIGVEETVVEGTKILKITIRDSSIGRKQLTNAHNLVPDARYLQFKDFNGDVVVTLCDALMAWLETEGYTP